MATFLGAVSSAAPDRGAAAAAAMVLPVQRRSRPAAYTPLAVMLTTATGST
jgi:hypothetical protein